MGKPEFEDTDGEQGFTQARIDKHVSNLTRMRISMDRVTYLHELERAEGPIAARKVSDEYARQAGLIRERA
jgi:hypothetical protein